jgi:hypothetical protein
VLAVCVTNIAPLPLTVWTALLSNFSLPAAIDLKQAAAPAAG